MEEDYKGHHITGLAWRSADRIWNLQVHIIDLKEADKVFVLAVIFTETYPTEEEAEQVGLSFAKKWIESLI